MRLAEQEIDAAPEVREPGGERPRLLGQAPRRGLLADRGGGLGALNAAQGRVVARRREVGVDGERLIVQPALLRFVPLLRREMARQDEPLCALDALHSRP